MNRLSLGERRDVYVNNHHLEKSDYHSQGCAGEAEPAAQGPLAGDGARGSHCHDPHSHEVIVGDVWRLAR